MMLFFYTFYIINFLPENIKNHFLSLLKEEDIRFKLTKPRKSKFGDYRYNKLNNTHTITVNNNLNPYAFTITFLHEIAHKTAFCKYGFKIAAHGKEWKSEFQHLLIEMLGKDFFPKEIVTPLLKYIDNPKATTSASPNLIKALAQFDSNPHHLTLENINEGDTFIYQKKKYSKVKKRRTRSLCIELKSNKKYLILETTPINPLN